MKSIDELLALASADDVTNMYDIQFMIDENLRTISIPKDGVVAGVVGDHNVNRVNFKMNRYYNGFDMLEFTFRVNFINANGDKSFYPVDDVTVSDDFILFSWLVDAYALLYEGDVYFIVRAVKTNYDGFIEQAFDTTLGKMKVLEGMDVDSSAEQTVINDYIKTLEAELKDYADSCTESIIRECTKQVELVTDAGNKKITEIIQNADQKKEEFDLHTDQIQNDIDSLKGDLDEISEIKQSRNHCDNTRESGYINYSNGNVVPYNTLWHSAYMPITAGKVYTYPNFQSSHYAFYDNAFNFISHSNDNDITTFGGKKNYNRYFIAPDNACYVRLTTQLETGLLQLVEFDSIDDISDVVINESVEHYRYLIPKIREKSIKETMLSDGSVSNSKILDKSVSKAKVDFVIHDETTNFVKITDFFKDGYIDKNGNVASYISSSQKFYYTDFVEVIPNAIMYSKNIYPSYYAFFNENKEFISSYDTLGNLSNGVIKVPENAKYIRFTVIDNSLSDVWISTKNEKPLPYDYILDIKTKNTNTPEINNDVNIKVYKKGNLLKLDEVTSGYINSSGTVTPYSTLWCTGYCEVEQGKLYFKGFLLSQYYAFYDENKNVIATYETLTAKQYTSYIYELDVPENAKYFRCTTPSNPATTTNSFFWISNSADMPYEEDENIFANTRPYTLNPENPCDYSGLSVSVFNKCACIGDSLTYGGFNLDNGASYGETTSSQALADKYSYPTQFKKITGVEVDNLGTSGVTSVSWYEQYKNNDFASYDMAIIHLGVNDSAFSVSDDDTKTALTNIINMLKSSVKNIKIYLCTIVPAYANKEYSGYSHKSELIRTFYAENYENDSDVVLLDMEKYSHARRYTSYTAGHLSALGYYRFAKDLASYISWHIDNNLRDYRFIQFIGNDGVYNGD